MDSEDVENPFDNKGGFDDNDNDDYDDDDDDDDGDQGGDDVNDDDDDDESEGVVWQWEYANGIRLVSLGVTSVCLLFSFLSDWW